MKLNDIQYKIIMQKLDENGWDVATPNPKSERLLSPAKNYFIYTHVNQRHATLPNISQQLIINNQEVSLGFVHHHRLTWGNLVEFIELSQSIPAEQAMP